MAGFALLAIIGRQGNLGMTVPAAGVSTFQAVGLEAILTFFLVTAVFGSAVANRNGNLAGLAIGLVLGMDILMGGSLTGASMNPARTFGPALAMGDLSAFPIYLVGPALGAAIAALVYDRVFLRPTSMG